MATVVLIAGVLQQVEYMAALMFQYLIGAGVLRRLVTRTPSVRR